MKQWKRWLLILAVSGPTVTNLSCASMLGRALRDAAVDGAAGFVEGSTEDILVQFFDTADE